MPSIFVFIALTILWALRRSVATSPSYATNSHCLYFSPSDSLPLSASIVLERRYLRYDVTNEYRNQLRPPRSGPKYTRLPTTKIQSLCYGYSVVYSPSESPHTVSCSIWSMCESEWPWKRWKSKVVAERFYRCLWDAWICCFWLGEIRQIFSWNEELRIVNRTEFSDTILIANAAKCYKE